MAERFLVTGALGCLGAWTTALLAREGTDVVAFDLEGSSDHRLAEVASPEELERVVRVAGDVTDLAGLERALAEREITHVVHLAALQVPFCRADPPRGAHVNVVGTVNVLEAARRRKLASTVAYASSAAVYDRSGAIRPETLYGATKVANESMARVYWEENGVASVGLRPYTVYGPARDQGVTAAPTQAMRAAALGERFHIPYGGRTELHYAPDVARALIGAARRPPRGASVYDFPGESVSIGEVVAAIDLAAPEAAGLVTCAADPLPFPDALPGEDLDAETTPLADGIRATIAHYRSLATRA